MNVVTEADGYTNIISGLIPGPDGPPANPTALNAAVAAAANSAQSAATAASLATAIRTYLNSVLLPPSSVDPNLDGNGSPLILGAFYYNLNSLKLRIYTASGWQDYDAEAQSLLVQISALQTELNAIATAVNSSQAEIETNTNLVASYCLSANDAATAARAAAELLQELYLNTNFDARLINWSQLPTVAPSGSKKAWLNNNVVNVTP